MLTGAGPGCRSGGNIKEMVRGVEPMLAGSPQQMQEAYRTGIQMIPRLFHSLDGPVIAAVNGAANRAGGRQHDLSRSDPQAPRAADDSDYYGCVRTPCPACVGRR